MKCTSSPSLDLGFSRKVQAMEIQIGPFEFTILNMHLAPRSKDDRIETNDYEVRELKKLSSRLVDVRFPLKNLMLIGDFNTYPIDDDLNKRLRFENIFKPQEYTNVCKNQCYDNIIVHQKLKLCCTSSSVQDIIVDGDIATAQLKNMFDHLPICAEFKIPRQLDLKPAYGYMVDFD